MLTETLSSRCFPFSLLCGFPLPESLRGGHGEVVWRRLDDISVRRMDHPEHLISKEVDGEFSRSVEDPRGF